MNNEIFKNGPYTPGEIGTPLYYGSMPTPNQQTAPNQSGANPNGGIYSEYMNDVLQAVEPIKVNVYMTFNGSKEWLDKKFSGILEAAGRDHIIVSDPTTGHWVLLPNIYIDYIEFDESIKKYIQSTI